MAITKILARKGPLADGVSYILNEEKTDQLFTVHLNCDPGREVQEMLDTKQAAGPNGKMDGVVLSHRAVLQARRGHPGAGPGNRQSVCRGTPAGL